GHPDLALSLNNLGALLKERGDLAGAEPYYRDALAMSQHLVATFADAAAEAETLNYLTQLPNYRDVFLSATANRTASSATSATPPPGPRPLRGVLGRAAPPGPPPGPPPTPSPPTPAPPPPAPPCASCAPSAPAGPAWSWTSTASTRTARSC